MRITPSVTVVLPWRASDDKLRQRNFDWICGFWEGSGLAGQLLYADSGHEEFNRAASRNLGAERAEGEVLIVADADTFGSVLNIKTAISQVQKDGGWVLPYEHYYNLTEQYSARLVKEPYDFFPPEEEIAYDHKLADAVSGVYVVRTQDWIPQDEDFRAWGYDDRASQTVLDCLVSPHRRLPGYVCHIYHDAPESKCFGQPEINHNRQLNALYDEAARSGTLKEFLSARPAGKTAGKTAGKQFRKEPV